MARLSYAEKLRDPRWQRKRLEIMERDGFACVSCGVTGKTLHVHHGYYERGLDPWDYAKETLWTLCESCHTDIGIATAGIHRAIAELVGHPDSFLHCVEIIRLAIEDEIHDTFGTRKRHQQAQQICAELDKAARKHGPEATLEFIKSLDCFDEAGIAAMRERFQYGGE